MTQYLASMCEYRPEEEAAARKIRRQRIEDAACLAVGAPLLAVLFILTLAL